MTVLERVAAMSDEELRSLPTATLIDLARQIAEESKTFESEANRVRARIRKLEER